MNVTVTGVGYAYIGFGMSRSNPIKFYVTHYNLGEIFVFDENWNLVSRKSSFLNVYYMTPVGNYFYITGYKNIWKTDQQLNVSITHTNSNLSSPSYCGLYYNATSDLIYVASQDFQVIQVFNLDLTLNDSFSITPYKSWSLNEHNSELYVGTTNGTMLVIVNKQIIKQFNGCNQQSDKLFSILFDDLNNIATSCANKRLYLYNKAGTYLNKSIIPTDSNPYYIGFDSKSRLVVVTTYQISIYY
jgi:hypothetical protein